MALAHQDGAILEERSGDYIHLIENDANVGLAAGNNVAIRYAMDTLNPDYVFPLNNDTTAASLPPEVQI